MHSKQDLLKIIESNEPLQYKCGAVMRGLELTWRQKTFLAVELCDIILPVYEEDYPNDNYAKECLEGVRAFLNGQIPMNAIPLFRGVDKTKTHKSYCAAEAIIYTAAGAGRVAASTCCDTAAEAVGDAVRTKKQEKQIIDLLNRAVNEMGCKNSNKIR